jgi:Zinc carboxypeptidase
MSAAIGVPVSQRILQVRHEISKRSRERKRPKTGQRQSWHWASARAELKLRMGLLLAALILFPLPSHAQQMDPDFAASVKAWTTRPEFLSPLVDHLPKSATVPSPKDVLGYYVGAPKKLTYYEDLVRYYRALEAKSPRVKVVEIGKTEEGRECVVVFVGSEESIRNLDETRKNLALLADPRGIAPEQARDITARTKPIYHVMGGLHSGETGPSEMLMELAYRLVTEDTPLIQSIREHVIVSITPAADPDGRDRYTDWYYKYKINEVIEEDNVGGPPYWGKYVYHDDNRDINYSQLPMQRLLAWYLEWHPPIMHELHESEPFMYTFSGQAPQNPTLDPILYGELPWFANFEMSQMVKYGMPGVWTHAFVDMWSPGYLGFMSSNHNGMMRMYETFGNGGANTMHRHVEPVPMAGRAPRQERDGPTEREWYRPLPAYKEVDWSMRNNTNYMETGVLTALELTAAFPQIVLDDFYRKSRNSVESGKKEAPFGYVIPIDQPDLTRVAFVVNILRLQGIEVGRSKAGVKLKEGVFPAGSLILKRDQPYGRLAKILLEKQVYPDQNLRTYDDAAWTMGLMAHVKTVESADPQILQTPVELIGSFHPEGQVEGSASAAAYAVVDHGSPNMITLRYRLRETPFRIAEQTFKDGDTVFPPGSFLLPGSAYTKLKEAVQPLGLKAVALAADPKVSQHDVDLPRLAIYSTWGSTQDVGWVRYAFDKYEIAYDLIFKERVRQGNLRAAYDVIVIPNQGRTPKGLVFDIEPKKQPLAYEPAERFKSLGEYGSSPDITGGMGLAGAVELQKFIAQGGVLVTLGVASGFPPAFGITRRLEAASPSAQFYAPGPIVQAEILDPSNPIFYGYPERTVPVRWANGPLLSLPQEDRRQILMRFPGGDASILSGLMKGANEIRNAPAVVDVPVGQGRVVLFTTNPCYRWQNLGEFRMLFNTVMNFNDFKPTGSPDH